MEFIYVGSAFCFGWWLNRDIVREASIHAPLDTIGRDTAINRLTDQWTAGLGAFTHSPKPVNQPPIYRPDAVNPETVSVKTTVTIRPFFPIRWFADVPGLGKNLDFVYETQAPQEEKGKN
jgi:hypothetical protein